MSAVKYYFVNNWIGQSIHATLGTDTNSKLSFQ